MQDSSKKHPQDVSRNNGNDRRSQFYKSSCTGACSYHTMLEENYYLYFKCLFNTYILFISAKY